MKACTRRERMVAVVLLVVAIALWLLSQKVGAGPIPSKALVIVDPDEEMVYRGQAFDVSLVVLNAEKVRGYRAELTYSDCLSPTGELTGIAFGSDVDVTWEDGQVTLAQEGKKVTGIAPLVTVEFVGQQSGDGELALPEIELFDQDVYAVIDHDVRVHPGYCQGDYAAPWGFIDLADIMAILPAWNSDAGDPEYVAWYDVDGDGHIGLRDVMVVVSAWNTPCGERDGL